MLRHTLVIALWTASLSALAAPPTGITAPAAAPTPARTAWDDLRWLMTAFEAYSTDNNDLYAPSDGPREGVVADLDAQMEVYYANTYPKNAGGPARVDPWGRPYRFIVSNSRKHYALYTLGPDGRLDPAVEEFLARLKNDRVTAEELEKPRVARNVVVSSGIVFAPVEVLMTLAPNAAK